jgi:hypothetical protein
VRKRKEYVWPGVRPETVIDAFMPSGTLVHVLPSSEYWK